MHAPARVTAGFRWAPVRGHVTDKKNSSGRKGLRL